MNKRITSLTLVFVMVLSLLATAVPVFAEPAAPNGAEFSLTASETSVSPGDIITITVCLQQKGSTSCLQCDVLLPDGLEYVTGSGAVTEGLAAELGFADLSWTDDVMNPDTGKVTLRLTGYGAEFSNTEIIEVVKFQCKVLETTPAGTYTVDFERNPGLFLVGGGESEEWDYKPLTAVPVDITVTAAPKPATGITLNKDELTLTAGKTETLVATVTPSDSTDTVTWESNKTDIATVDSTGKVTAVAPGEAIITAKAGEKTATCTVKVSCAHNLETVSAKESNCTDKGWDEYQKCTLCGALFNMSGSSIAEIPYRALNDDHDFNMGEWGYKGADGHAHVCNYNSAHHDTVAAHNFGDDDTCDICGYERTHVCANHLTKVEAKPADCTNPGNIAHYKCSCGKLYEDATAARELTEGDVNRGALGHDWIGATCTEPKTCDRCGETEGTALGHNWATEWSSNADSHWHACTRCDAKDGEGAHNPGAPATETTPQTCTDCGYVIESATGHVCANHLTKVDRVEADCTNPGNIEHYKCSGDTGCGKLYEDRTASVPLTEEQVKLNALGHNWADEWKSDATGHWHACTRCDAKNDEDAHNPGAPATETTPQTCNDCGYVIDPATGHLCINHLEEVPEVPATCTATGTEAHFKCTDPACGKLYWDDDAYDLIDDPDDLVIDALDHAWADEWSSDATNHWHACTRCDAKTDEAAHTPDHPDGATFEYPVLCVECHYEMEAQLEEGTIRVELPFKLTVEKTGELDPGKEIFKFMAEEFGAPVEYELIASTLETNGAKTYDGVFIFTIMEGDADNLSEGFIFRQVKGDAEGWTYDETKFYAVPIYNENGDGVEFWNIYYLDEEGMPDEDNRPNGVSFTNSY